jgi:hypothetical protein
MKLAGRPGTHWAALRRRGFVWAASEIYFGGSSVVREEATGPNAPVATLSQAAHLAESGWYAGKEGTTRGAAAE